MQKGFAAPLLLLIVVLVAGGFFWYYQNKNFYQPGINSSPVSSSKTLPQSELKYTNSALGFEFSYPSALPVQPDSEEQFNKRGGGDFRKNFTGYISYEPGKVLGAVVVLGKDGSFDKAPFSLWVFDNPDNLPIDGWFRDYWYYPYLWGDYTDNGRNKIAPLTEATVAGQLAKSAVVTYSPGSPKFIYLAGSGKIFLFRVLEGGDQVLSSFKFLNSFNPSVATKINNALKQSDGEWDLDLSESDLTEFPSQLLKLKNLRTLYLNQNKIAHLPDEIAQFKKLQLLDLTGNPISQEELLKLRKLLPNTKIFLLQPMALPYSK